MTKKMKNKIFPITIYLTHQQIEDAYRQSLEKEHPEWFYKPEVVKELLKRDYQAMREFKAGKTVLWEDFRKEMKV
ncbi:MAG: hypothetical protein AAB257_06060 [Nitrospinota bacterium]